jgi:hypothetical protein
MDKLNIRNEMLKFDQKDRTFFDDLSEEEQKKFSPYLMIRWGSSIDPNPVLDADDNWMLQSYYLESCNQKLNQHFFDISTKHHKKLLWLLASSVSPGFGPQKHSWIAPRKKESSNSRAEKFLAQQHPQLKADEIELLAKINDKRDIEDRARDLGWDEGEIRKAL